MQLNNKFLILFFLGQIIFAQTQSNENKINLVLNNWHKAAATVNFNEYFAALTSDAIFIGTDATENWNKTEFMAFAKPYFDKGKAWNFTSIQRHIFFSEDKKTAWFDELLSTQMKICRGSGVLIKIKNNWKIKQYVLSMTIPNDKVEIVTKTKAEIEDVLIEKLKNNKK